MEEIYDWVKNIVIYMILNTIIMNLLGNSSYKKYISVVSGLILVLIVISPFMNLMKMENSLDYYLQSNNFAVETADFKNDLKRMEEKQSNLVFSDYRDKIKQQVEGMLLEEDIYINKFDIIFDRDIQSDTFGYIKRMDIIADCDREKVKTSSQLDISRIEIVQIEIENHKEKKEVKELPSPMEINIKNKLSDFYNIEPDNINISIQGG